ncbi:helix-turn-helix domain-containing protein [Pseudoflavonifractor sp. BIOML-A6]|jgi:toxin-antitoxin system, antitoxin component, xre family|nr:MULTISPECIES: helix-turn-helix transcriptional regulator [unclassified Pseudoflavonifractor]KAB4839589.1 helix-turn-helix transcriptional regulator [Bacteroides thetaiotaomicron]MTQ98760.1 helix-turn-helix domain-containing protein [Pseudoflavonifractor sp. BIOML-A16]MTR08021.1 helix-turn-helix domain-containing protein [Pseudoflavonifractor sp. BIOML-A15]MTR34263.1 helix-turn-helix domain-containing protein [Pseudoflavonifractor sp. BIOML-A14]MTR75004.1 helix-turn-helix domain-containing p
MELGDLITFYRKQAGLTIDELAEKSDVPKGTLNKIIGGVTKAPTLDNMKAIARALGKNLSDFDDDPTYAKKSPAPAEATAGEISLAESNNLLVALGYIKPGEQISDEDLSFLQHVIGLLDAWFDKRH